MSIRLNLKCNHEHRGDWPAQDRLSNIVIVKICAWSKLIKRKCLIWTESMACYFLRVCLFVFLVWPMRISTSFPGSLILPLPGNEVVRILLGQVISRTSMDSKITIFTSPQKLVSPLPLILISLGSLPALVCHWRSTIFKPQSVSSN